MPENEQKPAGVNPQVPALTSYLQYYSYIWLLKYADNESAIIFGSTLEALW